MPSASSENCSCGSYRREVKPAACSSRQKSLRGFAKWARAAAETRPGLIPQKTTRKPGASTSGTALGVLSATDMSPRGAIRSPKGVRRPPLGTVRAEARRVCAGFVSRGARALCGLDGVPLRLELLARARVDPRFEVTPQVLAGDGRGEARPARLELDDGDCRIPPAVAPRVALRLGQRSQPPHGRSLRVGPDGCAQRDPPPDLRRFGGGRSRE